jgi:hypothetical protein
MTSAPAATATMTAMTSGRGISAGWLGRGVVGSPEEPRGCHTFM